MIRNIANCLASKWLVLLMSLAVAGCSGSGGGSVPPPPTGRLKVEVTDTTGTETVAVQGARVTVLDGESGQLIKVLRTDANGLAATNLGTGQVQLKVAAQGYEPSPASAYGSPLPYSINDGQVTTARYELTPLTNSTELGWISGKTIGIDGTSGVPNALVTAKSDSDGDGVFEWHSTFSDGNGQYALFNVPAATDVEITALRGGYNFTTLYDVVVTPAAGTESQNLASVEAFGSVGGQLQFLSVSNSTVDVTFLHPETRDVIPGLRTYTSSGYTVNGIPDGSFHAIASLDTDGLVLDPDHVRKFGVPQLVMSGGVPDPASLDFAVTGAVQLVSPENFQVLPVNALTFAWDAYPQTNDYILEVLDDKGNVIWGGSQPVAGSAYTFAKGTTQVSLDLTGVVEVDKLYRVRVYASADTNEDPLFKLISVSEDLQGVFRVGPAQ